MAQEQKKVDDQDFDAAFGEAVAEAEKQVQTKAPASASSDDATQAAKILEQEAADKKAAEAEADKKAAGDAEAKAAANKGKTAEELAAEEATAKVAAEQEAAAVKAKQEAEVKATAEQKAKDDAAAKDAAAKAEADQKTAEEKARKQLEDSIKPYEPTAEEKAAMDAFKKDFPTEYVGMEARLKAERQDMNAQVYKAVQTVLDRVYKDLKPLAQSVATNDEEKHATAIRTAHTDYDEVFALVSDWIKKQPAYLQVAYQRVYDVGSTQEVIDLVTRMKQETGRAEASLKDLPKDSPKPKPSADDIAAGMPVSTKRATPGPKGTPDPNNYDAAFDEATTA